MVSPVSLGVPMVGIPWNDCVMTSLEIRSRPWAGPFAGPAAEEWTTRRVESRVEFIVDGRPVSELGGIDADLEHVTVFDLADVGLAADVLMGRARLTDSAFPPTGRLPLLVCPCGDPREGTLTVRLSLAKDKVTWDQWAWEEDGLRIEWLPALPAYSFRLKDYSAVIDEAARLARMNRGKATSIIRVVKRRGGIKYRRGRRTRDELVGQLDWLDLEALEPEVGESSAGLHELLTMVESIRHELAEATTNPGYVLSQEQVQRAIHAAANIRDSAESFRLPGRTLHAVDWLRGNLPITI